MKQGSEAVLGNIPEALLLARLSFTVSSSSK